MSYQNNNGENELDYKDKILEKTTEIIGYYDTDLKVLWYNEAAAQILGIDRESAKGKHCHQVLDGSDAPCTDCPLIKARDTGKPQVSQRTSSDGRNWLIRGIPVLNEKEEVTALTEMVTEITGWQKRQEEKKERENRLMAAERLESMERMAGGVAHDFNNMLGIIMGIAEMSLMETDREDRAAQNMREILNTAERSVELTRQLQAFARKQSVTPKILDLNETIESQIFMLMQNIGENIDLIWKPGDGDYLVQIDPLQVNQIISAILMNSKEDIEGYGRIVLETEVNHVDKEFCSQQEGANPGSYIILTVSDNGRGMTRDHVSRLFEPFFASKVLGRSSGLSLAAVHGIIRQNGGFIHTYSEVGMGTTFKIYFPACRELAKDENAGTEESRDIPGGHETVLIVEDEKAILNFSEKMLSHLGYKVYAASSPEQALKLIDQNRIDLLLSDVVMPDMNGRDLAKSVLEKQPGTKYLFMSGYTAEIIDHHGILDRDAKFLQKPFTMEDMARKVRDVLDMAN